MDIYLEKITRASCFIKQNINRSLNIGIILGSGLGKLMDPVENKVTIDYGDIPGFPVPTVEGHSGQLIAGCIGGKSILAMKGRFHYYEGFDIKDVVLPIRVFKQLGINTLIVTNAAGGINKTFRPGDLMLITDHISLFAPTPLRGRNLDAFGPRFPDMSETYNKNLIKLAYETARELGTTIKEGTYAFVKGPMYETPAEIRLLGMLGADAVGMSTVPEVITARHSGMDVLGISCITNMAAGITQNKLSHDEVMDTARETEREFTKLITEIIAKMD